MTASGITELEPQLANCRAYWLGWGNADRADGELTFYRSGLDHPRLNGVLRLRDGGDADGALAAATARLAGVPWTWWVGPDSGPDLAGELLARGMERTGTMPVMAVELDRFADVEGPEKLTIDQVDGENALREWVGAFGPSFGIGTRLFDGVVRCETRRPDAPGSLVRFAGRMDGRVVGSSVLLEAHGVAGIYVVTTAADHRRRGIGARLTAAALRAGRERGLRVGTLQASGPGFPVYRRMGFRQVSEYQLFRPKASQAA